MNPYTGTGSTAPSLPPRPLPAVAEIGLPSEPVRLCFVSYRHLSALAQSLIHEYAESAHIEAVDAAFDSALALARAREEAQEVDAFVSAGSNAALLKAHVSAPVATIKADGYDLLLALQRAAQHASTVGVLSFGEPLAELDAIRALLPVGVVQRGYRSEPEMRRALVALRESGCVVVLGSSIVVEAAGQMGMHGILAYSERSIRQGIEDAIAMARVARQEVARYLQQQQRQQRHYVTRYRFEHMQGESPAFRRALASARRYASVDHTVLISGETGTGKEWFAQAIHHASARHRQPFVALNCSAVPESLLEGELFGHDEGAFTGSRRGGRAGLIEAAHTGTLFLDEIGDMPTTLQTRLLRVLQEREVTRLGSSRPIPLNVRVIAATHQPLRQRVEEGRFRADLYYRLNVLALDLPPLRERPQDIETLALARLQSALQSLRSDLPADQLLAPFLPAMRAHAWPGNLRELDNVCERLAARASEWQTLSQVPFAVLWQDLPELTRPVQVAAASSSADWRRVLKACNNNRSEAARRLGISRTTLWRWLREHPQAE